MQTTLFIKPCGYMPIVSTAKTALSKSVNLGSNPSRHAIKQISEGGEVWKVVRMWILVRRKTR